MFVREYDQGAAGTISVALMAGSEKPLAFGKLPARAGKYEVWNDTLAPDAIKAMLDAPKLQMGEGSSSPDGMTNMSIIEFDNSGLQQAWTQLLTSCPAARPDGSRPGPLHPAPAPR